MTAPRDPAAVAAEIRAYLDAIERLLPLLGASIADASRPAPVIGRGVSLKEAVRQTGVSERRIKRIVAKHLASDPSVRRAWQPGNLRRTGWNIDLAWLRGVLSGDDV